MLAALIAAACMAGQDILATIMVMAEAANRGWLAGFMDLLAWYVGIVTTTVSVTTLSGHNTAEKALVLVLVGAANVLGTKLGQVTGSRLLHRFPAATGSPDLAVLFATQNEQAAELARISQQQLTILERLNDPPDD